jgi:predicted TIM-barrel fold metal-dependent hydrolase
VAERFISVDDHVQEPPDLWTSRLSGNQWGDRVPHLERRADGGEQWVVDGRVVLDGHVASTAALMADRNQEPATWEEVPEAAYRPVERLKVMDAAGADHSMLFPTVAGAAGETFGRIEDPALEQACVRAYNDWLIEEWAAASDRFIPQCIVPLAPIEATVAEIRRAVGMGHRGVVFPAVPMDLRDLPHVGEPVWDPVWAVCEELNIPLCLHAIHASTDEQVGYAASSRMAGALAATMAPLSTASVVTLFLMSRVVLRHPRLKVVFAESALSWGVAHLEWIDHQFHHDGVDRLPWEHDGVRHEGYELTPSEMFHRQCYFNGWFDRVAPFAGYFQPEHILWSTNLPVATSTWPRTQDTIERCFEGVSADAREKILRSNASSLYGL